MSAVGGQKFGKPQSHHVLFGEPIEHKSLSILASTGILQGTDHSDLPLNMEGSSKGEVSEMQ